MTDPRRRAAALAAVLTLVAPSAAAAQARPPVLLAQLDEAVPTPTPAPLSEDPPTELAGDGEEDGSDGNGDDSGENAGPRLPDTGADAALVALLGAGLLASGGGMRLTLATGRGRSG